MYFLNNSIIKLLAEQKATLQEVQKSMSQMKHDLNPIRSGGGFKSPPPIFCSHAFNFGAALLCVGDFSQKIV